MADIVPLHGGLPVHHPDDTPAKLRTIADQLESGELGPIRVGVLVLMSPDGQAAVFGMGQDGGDMLAACGALAWGQHYFSRNVLSLAGEP